MLLTFIHFNIFSTINQTYIITLIILKIKDNLVILFSLDLKNIIFNLPPPSNHS